MPVQSVKTTPRRVNPFLYQEDFDVLYYGASGRSTRLIMERTQLTACQVTYRLHKEGIKRKDYRDGTSAFSRRMERMGRRVFEETVVRQLSKKYSPR